MADLDGVVAFATGAGDVARALWSSLACDALVELTLARDGS